MKKFWLLALWIILVAWTLAGCNNKENNTSDFIIEDITWENDAVINYNDTLVDLASNCIISEEAIWELYDDVSSSIEDIQTAIKNTNKECSDAAEKIEKLGDWEWDSSLKDWVLAILKKEIAYYTKFSELLPYLEKEDLTEEEKWILDEIYTEVETLDDELNEANENLVVLQENFAKNHWYELEAKDEDTTDEVLDEENSLDEEDTLDGEDTYEE